MIQLIQLNDPHLAQMLADYLQTQNMPCQVQSSETGISVWLLDETKASVAEREVQRFILEPHHPRYREASLATGKAGDLAISYRFQLNDRVNAAGATADAGGVILNDRCVPAVLVNYPGRVPSGF